MDLRPHSNALSAVEDAHVVFIANNHSSFRRMTFEQLLGAMSPGGLVYDYWNNFAHEGCSSIWSIHCGGQSCGGGCGMRAVVTGAAGFIGAYLCRRSAQGHQVVALDNYIRGRPARLTNIHSLTLATCDVRDRGAVASAIRGADVVFHQPLINGTENFYTQPELVLDVGIVECWPSLTHVWTPECLIWSLRPLRKFIRIHRSFPPMSRHR